MTDTFDNYGNDQENIITKFSDLSNDNIGLLSLQSSVNSSCNNTCDNLVYKSYVDGFSLLSKKPCYSANVTKMILNPVPDSYVYIQNITDGTLNINFSPSIIQYSVLWTWGQVPCVESATPPWAMSSNFSETLELNLSMGVNVFGFELCLNNFNYHYDVTVKYYNGSTLLGSLIRNQMIATGYSDGSARVFEVCSANKLINKVTISIIPTDGGPSYSDFYIAQIYYGTDVSSCCNCNEKYINFDFDIALNPQTEYSLQTPIKPQLLGFTVSNLQVIPVTGMKRECDVAVCNEHYNCCVSFDAMHVLATLDLMIGLPCIANSIDSPTSSTCSPFIYNYELDFDETCLICPGYFSPNINLYDLLTFVDGSVVVSNPFTLHVSCTLKFKCPKICC